MDARVGISFSAMILLMISKNNDEYSLKDPPKLQSLFKDLKGHFQKDFSKYGSGQNWKANIFYSERMLRCYGGKGV